MVCPHTAALPGLEFDHIGSYPFRHRRDAQAILSMGSDPVIAAVNAGSAAYAAGLQPGDSLLAIDGEAWPQVAAADSQVPVADAIANHLLRTPPGKLLTLEVERGGRRFPVMLAPPATCRTRFILQTDNSRSPVSDGINVAASTRFLADAASDDEAALVLAHELAHVAFADGDKEDQAQRRTMEDRADLLGTAIAACAGYDPVRGLGFYRRFDRSDPFRGLRSGSHRPLAERIRIIEKFARTQKGRTCPSDLSNFADPAPLIAELGSAED